MTTYAEQDARITALLQDVDTSTTAQSRRILQYQEALSTLARQQRFPQIFWFQAVAGQALYTIPDTIVDISHVLYNQKVLRYATEQTLDYSGNVRSWEANTGEPTYWTMDNQGPEFFRVIPPPLRTGSTIPSPTLLPLFGDLQDNLCVFAYEDPALRVTVADSILPVLLDWEDTLVFHVTAALAMQERTDQNLPLAKVCMALRDLWQKGA
jgi:hypothetical protein